VNNSKHYLNMSRINWGKSQPQPGWAIYGLRRCAHTSEQEAHSTILHPCCTVRVMTLALGIHWISNEAVRHPGREQHPREEWWTSPRATVRRVRIDSVWNTLQVSPFSLSIPSHKGSSPKFLTGTLIAQVYYSPGGPGYSFLCGTVLQAWDVSFRPSSLEPCALAALPVARPLYTAATTTFLRLHQRLKSLYLAYTVYSCVPYDSHNKQRLFP
jgi:hypothetical protein